MKLLFLSLLLNNIIQAGEKPIGLHVASYEKKLILKMQETFGDKKLDWQIYTTWWNIWDKHYKSQTITTTSLPNDPDTLSTTSKITNPAYDGIKALVYDPKTEQWQFIINEKQ